MDDISSLQALTTTEAAKDASLFKPRDAVQWKADRKNVTEVPGDKWWEGEVAPQGTAIAYSPEDRGDAGQGDDREHRDGQTVRSCIGTRSRA
jgi:hypothetical protein